MISKLDCLSHEVGNFGAVSQRLVERILEPDTPLQKWTIFVRETFQNSNDQRKKLDDKIGFKVELCEIPEDGKALLKATLTQDSPFQSDQAINAKNHKKILNMLVVADTNTRGLSGSRNPGVASKADSNFNNFFYFVGQLKEREYGGGIFGVGRNVLFSASKMRTILAFSVFDTENGGREQIFMGMSATDSFDHLGKLFTGRHWWGKVNAGKTEVSPYLGSEAIELATKFDLLRLLGDETGTVFVILDPDIEDQDSDLKLMADSFLVHAWPHLLKTADGDRTTDVLFKSMNKVHEVTDPLAANSPVKNFAKAYLSNGAGLVIQSNEHMFRGDVATLSRYAVKKKLMGQSRWIQSNANRLDDEEWLNSLGLHPGNCIALLRASKLVIRYEFAKIHQNLDDGRVTGVFVVNPDYEKVFRDSENATHDNWSAGEITLPSKGAKNPIRQFWNQLEEVFALRSESSHSVAVGDEGHAAEIANMLGSLIPLGLPFGGRPKPPKPTGGGTGGGGRAGFRKTIPFEDSRNPEITERNSDTCVGKFYVKAIYPPIKDKEYELRVKTSIWLGDIFETSAPAGTKEIEIEGVEIISVAGKTSALSSRSGISAKKIQESEFVVTIRYPVLAQVTCAVTAHVEEGAALETS